VEEVGLEVDERSVYASPFPFDAGLDEIVAFFGAAGAAVNSVRMRRHLVSKDFKGSAFVEFATKEEAEGVAGAALTFKGAPLVLRPKGEYVKEKAEARHARPNSPHNPEAAAGAAARPAKRAREEGGEEAEDGGEAAAAPAAPAPVFVPGCVVHFDFGADAAFGDAVTFGLVKDSFGGREAGLQYVDYAPGDKEGHARFDAPAAAAAALAAGAGGKMMVAGYEAAVRVLEGEEEVGYMGRVASQRAERERREGGGGRGGGRRGRGRGRGRGGGGGRRGRGRQ
jgi:lupus La protein